MRTDNSLVGVEEVVDALHFSDEALHASLSKIREQHNAALQEVSDRMGDLAKHATRIVYPDMFRDDILLGDSRVVIHTRKEVFENRVRFVTGAAVHVDGQVEDLYLKAFNVRNPKV